MAKQPSRWNFWWRPLAGVAGLAAMIVYSGGACRPRVEPGKIEALPGFAVPTGAKTLELKTEKIAARIEVVGTVNSEEKINLSARIGGYIKELTVTAGSKVTKGQVLAVLDDREILEQMAMAEAQFKQAEIEFKRTRELLEKKATTDQAFVAAESAFNTAKAQADRVRVMLTYAKILSPLDGIVTDRRVEVGDLANPGQVLLVVYDPKRMRLEAPVPVRLIEKLKIGQEVAVKLDRVDCTCTGRVSLVVSEIDPQSRTQTVKISLAGAGSVEVLPGTYGRFSVADDAVERILVPTGAVYRVGQLEMVQVLEQGRVLRCLVKTGQTFGDRVEILSGLQAGETILTEPVQNQGNKE